MLLGNMDAQRKYYDHQNDMGCNALMIAVAQGHYEVVQMLLKLEMLNLDRKCSLPFKLPSSFPE